MALLEEIKGDPRLISALTEQGFGLDISEKFNIKAWVQQQRDWKRGIWRLRPLSLGDFLSGYRLVYAYVPAVTTNPPVLETIVFLGLAPRSFEFDENHELTKRIENDYDALPWT